MENLRILAVDDDPFTVDLLAKKLGKEGFNIETASDSEEAVSLISENFFDIIITDLMMPGIDGVGVLEAAKARDSRTEVILLTAHASIKNAVEAMKKGAVDYLQKPINFYELILRLEKISAHRKLIKNALDLREAMDVTEQNASQTIQDLEMAVGRLQSKLSEIQQVVARNAIDAAKRIEIVHDILSVH